MIEDKPKIRLTKKRLAQLDLALSVDDILYEKFRRLNEALRKDADRLINNPKKVFRVVRRSGNTSYVLRIIDAHVTPEGTEIIVEV